MTSALVRIGFLGAGLIATIDAMYASAASGGAAVEL